jgi:hypothetical protein
MAKAEVAINAPATNIAVKIVRFMSITLLKRDLSCGAPISGA